MHRRISTLSRFAIGAAALAAFAGTSFAETQTPYQKWAAQQGLSGEEASPSANPDDDRYINAVEYAFGLNPKQSDNPSQVAPYLDVDGSDSSFVYRVGAGSDAGYRVMMSKDLKAWTPAPGTPASVPQPEGYTLNYHPITTDQDTFYTLEISVISDPEALPEIVYVGTVGTNLWDGMPQTGTGAGLGKVAIRTTPPKRDTWTSPSEHAEVPNTSKYPLLAGSSQGAFTEFLLQDYQTSGTQPPIRSWMGWFLWGKGVPPPGMNPGIHTDISGYPGATGYGTYDKSGWDYFNFQWKQTGAGSTSGQADGVWNPIRVDQQPLFLTPLTVNYNWAPGLFGYQSKPLSNFPNNTFYWKEKQIVRGVNISGSIPFFYQYGNKVNSAAVPDEWKQAWMYVATRPLETTVVVPSNLKPGELLQNGPWNKVDTSNDPFPYPVWDISRPAADQTPFTLQVDKIGDWHADLIWEAGNSRTSGTYYQEHRYKRSSFSQPGIGNYMKATVAQGSPFVWCETNNNRYAIFYNLIRTNLKDQIANNIGTNAGMVPGGPWSVPGVQGVKFVLLYGDHVNPNQWHQEVEPWYADLGGGADDTQLPGGFNPPPGTWNFKNGSGDVTVPGQHNHTYTAVFYREAGVQPVRLGSGKSDSGENNGTDKQGNPYFYLEFKNPGKNWFVVGTVPEMRYYNTAAVDTGAAIPDDPAPVRIQAAIDWAKEMGKYAFNYPTATKISYSVTNMYQTTTEHRMTMQNPFAASGASQGASTSVPSKTVMALNPHQYQPITLGPDYTKTTAQNVVWNPLRNHGSNFPIPASAPPNANKNTYKQGTDTIVGPSRWDYWSLRGNLKSIVSDRFTTVYPFQNFLPVMPPPNYEKTYKQKGIGLVNVTLPAGNFTQITAVPDVQIVQANPSGSGAVFTPVVVDGKIESITVDPKGSGYPNGTPPGTWKLVIDGPNTSPAHAHINVSEGIVQNVTMDDKGAGYSSTTLPTVTLVPNKGSGAIFKPIIDKFTGKLQQIDVIDGGSGYPDGMPPAEITVSIAGPTAVPSTYNVNAEAYAQISGGKVLAIFMTNNGAGYASTIRISQEGFLGDPQAIVIPQFDASTPPKIVAGTAQIIEAGAGFDFDKEITAELLSTDTGATVSVVKPGTITAITTSDVVTGAGNFSSPGFYPGTGGVPPAASNVHVAIPPSPTGGTQTATPQWKATPQPNLFVAAITNKGSGYSNASTAHVTINTQDYYLTVTIDGTGAGRVIGLSPKDVLPSFTSPLTVHFSSTSGIVAEAKIYPLYEMANQAQLSGATVRGYASDQEVAFTGGEIFEPPVVKPNIKVTIPTEPPASKGIITASSFEVLDGGDGFEYDIENIWVVGGQGFNALLSAVVEGGAIKAVKVIRPGSHYPQGITAFAGGGSTPAEFDVKVNETTGAIEAVTVQAGKGGSGYASQPNVVLVKAKPWTGANPDPVYGDAAKGRPATFKANVSGKKIISFTKISPPPDFPEGKYVPGTENGATADSLPLALQWSDSATPFARPNPSTRGYLASVLPAETQVGNVIYSSIIAQYTERAGQSLAPFGGSFIGKTVPNSDASAPDGYGLGGQLAASSRLIGDIYSLQQHSLSVGYEPNPTKYAVSSANTLPTDYEFPVLSSNSPYTSLSLGLKSSVQAMQRAVTLLFTDEPSHNSPLKESPNIWSADYFSIYDGGRIVINPSQTQPVWGVVSSVENPAYIPTSTGVVQVYENDWKTGLSKWKPGMLWSGFGVSDQWNDQHYFYGYYLSTAAIAGIFDQAWVPNLSAKPGTVWSDASVMGTALDQLLLTLANDPDNSALQSVLYKHEGFNYQKFAFFDQWSGHAWATGAQPGTTVAALLPASPVAGVGADPYGFWKAHGTDSDKYNGENENSIYEGQQAWSAAILWGGATDRKAVVDLGIYLYSTSLASADSYFLDKNYNLVNSADNKYSWVPVTTSPASVLKPTKNGGNTWKAGTDYTSGNPAAFYTPPPAVGGPVSAGQSLMKKVEVTNNNFFYAYPTGSKFIQAYPPTAWTLGMVRDTNYMRRWAGAMMTQEWNNARNSSLYQPGDWNAMAMTSALADMPFNPGDKAYPASGGNIDTPLVKPYIERLWSSWVTRDQRPGAQATLNTPFLATSVLDFLLALDYRGVPDWTYIAKVTNTDGTVEDNSGIVFTGVFTKRPSTVAPVSTKVDTTFVVFNPGWTPRHVTFHRMDAAGNILPANVIPTGVIEIAPKQQKVIPLQFDIVAP